MASTSAPRALSRAVRRKRWPQPRASTSTRHIATAPAAEYHEPEPPFPEPAPTLPSRTQRQQDIRNAKPFSDFLTDTFNRQHDYLRISLTERCNLRCLYCMPEEGIQLSPNKDLLTTAEIYYLSALFVNQGVNKIRLTGGEPTVRKDIIPLMQQIGSLRRNGLKEIALTTNGISLHRKLEDMVEAGLTGVNISLDTLDPHQFVLLTRRQGFDAVMKSINRVKEMNKLGAGIKLKINCVAMRGLNDHQILPFVEMTRHEDVEVRFIEYMPFDGNKWSERKMLPYTEMLDLIRTKYPDIERLKGAKNDTSKTWQVPGFQGKVGFITSMTHNFCGTCNRLRITSDGNLKVCLHGNAEVSLRDMLRKDHNNEPMDEAAFEALRQLELDRRKQNGSRFDGEEGWITKERELLDIIGAAVKRKKAKHAGIGELENMKNRPMILIGERSRRTQTAPSSLKRKRRSPTTGPNAPWSTLPLHLLHPTAGNLAHTRSYSSESRKPEDDSGDAPRDVEKDSSTTPSRLGSMLGFQSLSGLFQQPTRGRYSSRRRPEPTPSPESNVTSQTSDGDKPPPDPTFVPLDSPKLQPDAPSADVGSTHQTENGAVLVPFSPEDMTRKTNRRPGKTAFRKPYKGPTMSPLASGRTIYFHPSNGRRSPIRRRENPFKMGSSTAASEESEDFKVVEPPDATTVMEKANSGFSSNDAASVDSILDPGMTNVSFQSQKKSDPLSNSSSIKATPNTTKSTNHTSPAAPSKSTTLTHVTSSGEAHMVDVGTKESTRRIAVAHARVTFSNTEPFRLIFENTNKKGDVLSVARVAGIMASKRTADLIPLCHPIPISKVEVNVELQAPRSLSYLRGLNGYGAVAIHAVVECVGPTGVEMEALTAASGAALTVYDMCKAVDRDMTLTTTKVVYKSGGRSGDHIHHKWAEYRGRDFLKERGIDIEQANKVTKPSTSDERVEQKQSRRARMVTQKKPPVRLTEPRGGPLDLRDRGQRDWHPHDIRSV